MPAPRTLTAAEAAALVREHDSLGIPLGPGQPAALLRALGERERFDELTVFGALLVDLFPLFTRPGVRYLTGFFGPAEQFLLASGAHVELVPAAFRGFIPIAERLSPRVVATAAAPPDEHGRCSLSLHAGATVPAIRAAGADPERLLVVEVNPRLPRTLGLAPEHPHWIDMAEVDILVESDLEPLVLPDPEPSAVDRAIAEHVRTFVTDGCTLQTGIGGVPGTVARLLASGTGGGYGIHSEMFTNGLMELHRAGKVANDKGIFDGFSVCTFALGSRALYDWLDGNEDVRFLPVDVVNLPSNIAANRRIVTINSGLAVDLLGQVAADRIGGRQVSGVGGAEDFVEGPAAELEDRSLTCLPSTAVLDGEVRSRVVVDLPPRSTVTTPRHHVDVVITEHGVAELAGRTVRERAQALAEIAHPEFRDELLAEARHIVT